MLNQITYITLIESMKTKQIPEQLTDLRTIRIITESFISVFQQQHHSE